MKGKTTPKGKGIPISRPWIGPKEAKAASRAIQSGWLTQGPEVLAFEKEFAAEVGARHAVAVSNCTVALHLALRLCEVGPGDEVITVSHSFIATANSIRYTGATPVFVDVTTGTNNIDPGLVERAITPKTKAILAVHQVGMPCDLKALVEISERRKVPLIEDCACAIGSEIYFKDRWEKVGRPHGLVACFSFHPRKILTTGEGGMLTVSDPALDAKLRLWRQHGMETNDLVRHRSSEVVFEQYVEVGYNYRLTDVQGAIGREQLKRLPEILSMRRKQADLYFKILSQIPGLVLPTIPAWAKPNWQSFYVQLPSWSSQKKVMQALLDAGISTRRGVMCAHREPAYRAKGSFIERGGLRHSERAQDRGIFLPLFHELTPLQQRRVARELGRACAQGTPRSQSDMGRGTAEVKKVSSR
jgi:perosamine synthetase